MRRGLLALYSALLLGISLPYISSLSNYPSQNDVELTSSSRITASTNEHSYSSIRVAHIGNSIQYYNDLPRFLGNLLRQRYHLVTQDSCLHGGASIVSIAEDGNGMQEKFNTPAAMRSDGTYDIGAPTVEDLLREQWDFVVINDHTQAPGRDEIRAKSIEALQSIYLPLLFDVNGTSSPTVVFLMTAAYRKQVKDADQIGDFDVFTAKLQKGYADYQAMVPGSEVAPVGLAVQYLHKHYPEIWEGLYANDDFHPSPHGTLLQAYIVFSTITQTAPPLHYSPDWWASARYMQPPDDEPLPLPTVEEASFLRGIACLMCGVGGNGTCLDDGEEEFWERH